MAWARAVGVWRCQYSISNERSLPSISLNRSIANCRFCIASPKLDLRHTYFSSLTEFSIALKELAVYARGFWHCMDLRGLSLIQPPISSWSVRDSGPDVRPGFALPWGGLRRADGRCAKKRDQNSGGSSRYQAVVCDWHGGFRYPFEPSIGQYTSNRPGTWLSDSENYRCFGPRRSGSPYRASFSGCRARLPRR